jgi:hypothetical protein
MTQKKLKMVRARLFAACAVRRGSWYLENGCFAQHARTRLSRHGSPCQQQPRREIRRNFAHAGRI